MTNLYSGLRFTCSITKAIILAIILFGFIHDERHGVVIGACVLVCISLLFLIVLHILNGFEGIRSNTPAIIDVIFLVFVLILTIPELCLLGVAAWNKKTTIGRCEIMYEPAFVADVISFLAVIALIVLHLFFPAGTK